MWTYCVHLQVVLSEVWVGHKPCQAVVSDILVCDTLTFTHARIVTASPSPSSTVCLSLVCSHAWLAFLLSIDQTALEQLVIGLVCHRYVHGRVDMYLFGRLANTTTLMGKG